MRLTALALATLIVLGVTIGTTHRAHAEDIQIEEAPPDEDLGDLGSRRPGQQRKPEEPAKVWGNKGFYGIVAGTYAAEDLGEIKDSVDDQLNANTNVNFRNSLGFNVRAGYRWHPHLAAELEYEWLNGFDLDGTSLADVDYHTISSITVNGKAYVSTGRFEPFLLFGLGYYKVGEKHEQGVRTALDDVGDFGMKAGAGIQFYIIDHLALDMDLAYNFGESNLAELRFLSFSWGFMYRL